jgi:hypothetical protein
MVGGNDEELSIAMDNWTTLAAGIYFCKLARICCTRLPERLKV